MHCPHLICYRVTSLHLPIRAVYVTPLPALLWDTFGARVWKLRDSMYIFVLFRYVALISDHVFMSHFIPKAGTHFIITYLPSACSLSFPVYLIHVLLLFTYNTSPTSFSLFCLLRHRYSHPRGYVFLLGKTPTFALLSPHSIPKLLSR